MNGLLAALGWTFTGWTAGQVAWAAGIGVGCVVLWFLFRPRPPRIDVGSHVLWDQVAPRKRDPLRKELLMLLLQILMVLALALALGEPVREETPEDAAPEEDAAVVPLDRIHVVDRSLSMTARAEGGTRLDAVARAITDDVDGLPAGVRVALIGAGRDADVLVPLAADRGRLRLALRTLASDGVGSSLAEGLRLARTLATRRAETHVEVWTDDPRATELVEAFAAESGLPVTLRAPFAPAPNLAITAFDLRAAEGIPAEEEALVRVANPTPWPATALLALETADARLGEAAVQLAPGEEIVRRYRFEPLPGTGVEAVVRGAAWEGGPTDAAGAPLGDGLPADDRAYAWVQPVRPVTVALVSDGNRYLERVLALLPGVRLERITDDQYRANPGRVRDADVVFFDSFAPLPERDGPLPKRAVLLSPPASRSPVPVLGEADQPVVTDWDLDHPLFEGLVLRDLKVERSLVLQPAEGDVRLLGTTTGSLVVGREDGDRRLVVWGFDLGASDLPLRLAFPQTVVNIVLWMRDARPTEPALGDRHHLADPFWLDAGAPVTVTDLRQRAYAERADDTFALERATWVVQTGEGPTPYRFPRPGLFSLVSGETRRDVGVNLFSLDESRLAETPRGSDEVVPSPREETPEDPDDDGLPWLVLAMGVGVVGLLEFGLYTR